MISLFTEQALVEGAETELGEDAAGHARARRVGVGDPARLLDGRGSVARAAVVAVEKRRVLLLVGAVDTVPRPTALDVIVPVADKDRMLVAAEKCAELQVTSWRPVVYARSRSVSPRGEGPRFREKVLARMRSALEQSGGAWLPELLDEAEFSEALRAVDAGTTRLVLDSRGTSLQSHISKTDIALAIGPEGGLEDQELGDAHAEGWQSVALTDTVLRFETAIITAVGTVRALQFGR
jgi:16S rRNA (uracil1498-N3)-methyltransferase